MQISVPHISRIVCVGSIGFVCGIGCGEFFAGHIMTLCFFIACFVAMLLMLFSHHSLMWVMGAGLLMYVCGIYAITDVNHMIDSYDAKNGQKFQNEVIVREIVQKQWYAQITGYVKQDDMNVLWHDVKYPHIAVGDVLSLSCTLSIPDSDGEFDYRMYLATKHIYMICDGASYTHESQQQDVYTVMDKFRTSLERRILSVIPAPQSALASGLLLGGDDLLSDEMRDKFSRTGMSHIVAVSGYNVSIIITAVVGMMIYIGLYRRTAMLCAIGVIVLFVLLIGFPASGVRAGIMGVMVLCAASYGRITHAYSALIFAAALMLVHNPLLLQYDIGFQLSFLATIGILAVYPILERWASWSKKGFGLLEIILLTISAQVFVLPIIIYHFHTISIISLAVNVLVLPIIPFTMLVVLLLLCFHPFLPLIAMMCGWIAHVLLSYELYVIDFCAQLSWASIDVGHVAMVWMVVYYVIVGGTCIFYDRLMKKYEI